MGLLAACAAHHAPPHAAQRVSAASGQARALKLRTNRGCHLERRGPHAERGSSGQKIAAERAAVLSAVALFSAIAIELMVAHAAAAHPSPPRRVLFGKTGVHEGGWT